jgi:hypothetical protein
VLLGLAVIAGGRWDEPTLVGALLLAAMLCGALYAVPGRALPRGPGQWLPFSESDAFAARRCALPGRFLDASRLAGLLVLLVLLGGLVALHFVVRAQSPYRAVELLLGGAVLLPVFLTGRARELPIVPGSDPSKTLGRLLAGLRRRGLKAVPLARLPHGSSAPDELRVLLQPRGAMSGLVAVEVGVDHAVGLGGLVVEPYVVLRVREGSACAKALAGQLAFQRGRKADERVVVLWPKLPTISETLALVDELLALLCAPAGSIQPPSSARSASGKPASARKPARAASPAHAM